MVIRSSTLAITLTARSHVSFSTSEIEASQWPGCTYALMCWTAPAQQLAMNDASWPQIPMGSLLISTPAHVDITSMLRDNQPYAN